MFERLERRVEVVRRRVTLVVAACTHERPTVDVLAAETPYRPHEVQYTVSQLVSSGLLAVSDGRFELTEAGERWVREVIERLPTVRRRVSALSFSRPRGTSVLDDVGPAGDRPGNRRRATRPRDAFGAGDPVL